MAKKKDSILDEEEEKKKAISTTLDNIIKAHGKGSIMKLGDNQNMNISVIPTGSINLNYALGVGGLPRGRIVEIYGSESSGKTTVALHVLAEAQKNGGVVAFIDAEHALDPIYAKALGVNIDELLISQPDFGEQALDIVEQLVKSNAVDVIVVDSVAALVPKAEIEGEITEQQMGLQARLMSKALRKLTGHISRSNTIVIFINQIREKIGFSPMPGIQTTTSGGRALKFFSTVRIEIKRGLSVKQGEEIVGNEVTAKITKNKVAPPFREAKFNIMYGTGISQISEILEIALDNKICTKSGSWFSYGDRRLGQGKINVENLLKEDQELFNEIKEKALEALKNPIVKAKKNSKAKEEIEENEDTEINE